MKRRCVFGPSRRLVYAEPMSQPAAAARNMASMPVRLRKRIQAFRLENERDAERLRRPIRGSDGGAIPYRSTDGMTGSGTRHSLGVDDPAKRYAGAS